MSRVVSRWVIPNTTDAKRANTKAALKWVSWIIGAQPGKKPDKFAKAGAALKGRSSAGS